MLLSSLVICLLPLISAAAGPLRVSKCLPSGTEKEINAAFAKGGKSATVTLCPGSVHRLNATIFFTASRQTLTTEGDPKDRNRALLIVEGKDQAIAIQADCKACGFATIKSIVVDGNRPQLFRVPMGQALVEMGNADGQTIRDCRLYEPRGWSALHFREGDRLNCRKAVVADNEIGPCGEEWDDEYDGTIERIDPPSGNPRADGISLACQDSLVENNIVYDATDGAIVLFGSAGTEVRNNQIYARTRVVLGGINLVDYAPWKGDYFGVTVHHNHFHALGRYLKVGIVIGPSSWSDDTESIVHSASVTDNTFHGRHFGYGIVVSSAKDFTVLRNTVDPDAIFSGTRGPRCPKAPENGKPTAFLINRGSARGTFQDEFVNGEVQHIICINPPDVNGQSYVPWRFRNSPPVVSPPTEDGTTTEDDVVSTGTFDTRLAEALVAYQMTLLDSMNVLNAQIEQGASPLSDTASEQDKVPRGTGNHQVDRVIDRLDGLEKGEKGLKKELDAIQGEFEALSSRIRKSAEDTQPIVQAVWANVAGLKSRSGAPLATGKPKAANIDQDTLSGDDKTKRRTLSGILGISKGTSAVIFFLGAIIILGLVLVRGRWRRRVSTRNSRKTY
ncbi:pectin lyase fold/virulence factor [Naematelia encephala]|uniref:Pectin lyase fold/virulence factor n=1 Tax=Naematelia encephala TaxID=71784 RepID=A0A1Y2B0V4_9TREE|nr:pectin lyase fold/virulence factor [Naematelia encephala]